jgi:hypothetical protein
MVTWTAALLVLWAALVGCGRRASVTVSPPTPAAPLPTIQLGKEGFEVTGLDPRSVEALTAARMETDAWQALFAVYVDDKETPTARPPVAGSYRVASGVLRFEPRYPLQRGVRYRAVLDPTKLPGITAPPTPVVAEFTLPRPERQAPTEVTHVYPSRAVLPENQLKFYIHFSAPMSRGEAYEHIRLLDAAGKKVEAPFLELLEELWDPSGRRFTLFIDPGRIKRGLKPREEVGPALEAGKNYTLLVDRDWPDATGEPLKESCRKAFRVGPPDEKQPDPKSWTIEPPAAATRNPVVVTFPEPLDHAMLERVVAVAGRKGEVVAGAIRISDEETRWHFTPEGPWAAGSYDLVAETTLEDLAGNSIGRPFEVDIFHPLERRTQTKTVKVSFQVR